MENNYLSLREVQLEELEILKKVTEYINKKNLTYYLTDGTLLGAIRHKGFIPWDDDIDIGMPRKDYDILMNYLKNETIDNNYEVLSLNIGNANIPFGKVINKNISIKSRSVEDNYLWIDIFPFDGLPDSIEESNRLVKRILLYRKQMYLRSIPTREILSEKKSIFNKIIKIILKPISYRHSMLYYSNKIDKLAKKYSFEESNYVGDIVWTDNSKVRLKKEWMENTVEAKFENIDFKIPIGWDQYMKTIFGDYIKLPPKEKQESHKIKARKIN